MSRHAVSTPEHRPTVDVHEVRGGEPEAAGRLVPDGPGLADTGHECRRTVWAPERPAVRCVGQGLARLTGSSSRRRRRCCDPGLPPRGVPRPAKPQVAPRGPTESLARGIREPGGEGDRVAPGRFDPNSSWARVESGSEGKSPSHPRLPLAMGVARGLPAASLPPKRTFCRINAWYSSSG